MIRADENLLLVLVFTAVAPGCTGLNGKAGFGDVANGTGALDTSSGSETDSGSQTGSTAESLCPPSAPFDQIGAVRFMQWVPYPDAWEPYTNFGMVSWMGVQVWEVEWRHYSGQDSIFDYWTCDIDGASLLGSMEANSYNQYWLEITYDSPQLIWPAALVEGQTWSTTGVHAWIQTFPDGRSEQRGSGASPRSFAVTATDVPVSTPAGDYTAWEVTSGTVDEFGAPVYSLREDVVDGVGVVSQAEDDNTDGLYEAAWIMASCTGFSGCEK